MTDKPNIDIRRAYPQDAPHIAQMIDALNRYEGHKTGITEHGYHELLLKWLSDQASECVFLLAWHQNMPVGYAAFYKGYDIASMTTGTHLGDIYVTENYRRHGAGRALLGQVAAHTLSEGGVWLSLTVLKNNESAKAFYAAMKGVDVGVDFVAFGQTALHQWVNG